MVVTFIRLSSLVILPLVRPALATIAIFTFLSSWNELMFAMTFISDDKYKTLTVGIQSLAGMYYTEWGPIGAGMVVATFPVLLIYILLSRQVQNAILAGAVKGKEEKAVVLNIIQKYFGYVSNATALPFIYERVCRSSLTEIFNCSIALSNTLLGQPMFSRICPSPPIPKISPLFNQILALFRRKSFKASWDI